MWGGLFWGELVQQVTLYGGTWRHQRAGGKICRYYSKSRNDFAGLGYLSNFLLYFRCEKKSLELWCRTDQNIRVEDESWREQLLLLCVEVLVQGIGVWFLWEKDRANNPNQ